MFSLYLLTFISFKKGARGQFNPECYEAYYFGHKVHLDQNEKLAMFGVTHAIAVDGYSRRIVGHASMPVKNNLIIYEEVYRYFQDSQSQFQKCPAFWLFIS